MSMLTFNESCKPQMIEQHKTSNSKAFLSPINHTQNYGYESQEKLRGLEYKIVYLQKSY